MGETQRKQRPNLERVVQEVVSHCNAALSHSKAQFRKSHIFHGVKSLSVLGLGGAEEVLASLLHAKKGVGDALAPVVLLASLAGTRAQWTASDQARGRYAPRG